jgi:hypothetical protein
MAIYDYPQASFESELSTPNLGGTLKAASSIPGFVSVRYKWTDVGPEIPAIIDFVSFEFEPALNAGQKADLDNIIRAYKNPSNEAPPTLVKSANEISTLDYSGTSASFVTHWTSLAISKMKAGEEWVIFCTVLQNNPSSTSVGELNWQIETSTDSFADLEPGSVFPTHAIDNKATNVVGMSSTTFHVIIAQKDAPRVRLQSRCNTSHDLNNPRIFAMHIA